MRRFNLSEWALTNRSLVLFLMILLGIIGAWSYKHLGQSEDPPFTFKAMVVRPPRKSRSRSPNASRRR